MAKRTPPKQYNVCEMQPDEINALRELVQKFMSEIQHIDNEIELLKEDRKETIESYADKLDLTTFQAALKTLKIQQGVQHRDTYDLFLEVLMSSHE